MSQAASTSEPESRSRRVSDWSLLQAAMRKYWKPMLLGAGCLLTINVFETLPPLILKEVVDRTQRGMSASTPLEGIAWLALAYLAGSLVESAGRYGWRMFLVRASMQAGRDLRERFTSKLFSLGASFFDRTKIGDLMSLGSSDTEAVRMALGPGMITAIDAFFYLLTIPVAMYWLSPDLTFYVLAPLPLVPVFVLINERRVHARFKALQEQQSQLSSVAQESLAGVRVTKAFAFEEQQIERFLSEGKVYQALALRLIRVQAGLGPALEFFATLGLAFLLFFGAPKVLLGKVSVGTLVAFQRYVVRIIWPLTAIGFATNFFQRALASSGRLLEVLHTESDVPEPPQPRLPAGAPANAGGGTLAPWRAAGGVEFRGLSFRFPQGGEDDWILRQIDLKIAPGERVAFIGAIGSGKTALLSLLPRLYPVSRGQLFIDQVDVNDWPLEELRRQVAYVGQELFLFSETVRENLLFGWGAQDNSLVEATQLAAVHEEIESLAEGYQTPLGERGVNLSGGQKQRVTIARALACRPAILILDDALSSVDVQTEEKILRSLRGRPQKNTELIAAHRISTVKEADRIVVLDRGVIVQQGNHSALLKEKTGTYARFYERQRLWEDLESYRHPELNSSSPEEIS